MQRIAHGFRAFGWLVAACVLATPNLAKADQITAFAASSLRDALGEIAQSFEAETGVEVVLVFAGSSAIARQVAQGAPADVVLLADETWAQWLVDEEALTDPQVFATNRLVLVSARPLAILQADDIPLALQNERLAMALVDAVPAGRYGRDALMQLGLWEQIEPQVVQAPNVRAALRLVERGEAVMGIGYVSDLVALPDLYALFEFGMDAPPVAVYSGGAVTSQGTDFMTYIQARAGQSILHQWGFLPPYVQP